MIKRLICAIFGHRYALQRVLNRRARKVGCTRCGRAWSMHDPTRTMTPWGADLEAMYAPGGDLHDLDGIDSEAWR